MSAQYQLKLTGENIFYQRDVYFCLFYIKKKFRFRYAVPEDWYTSHKVRRYGFHGTSHKYVANEASKILGKSLENLDLITAHLGHGCSIAAIKG